VISPTPQEPDDDSPKHFEAEFLVKVQGMIVIDMSLVLNHATDHERRIDFAFGSKLLITQLKLDVEDEGGFFTNPSYVDFLSDGSGVEFGVEFVDTNPAEQHRRTHFLLAMWRLAWHGVRPVWTGDLATRRFTAKVEHAMETMAATEYFNLLDFEPFADLFFPKP